MKKNGRVVLLTAKPETILNRVKDNHDRPLLDGNKNVDFIADLMEKRREKYEAASDIVIETDGKDKLEILRRCAAEPFSAEQLAASMNLNSGTVSRNVYGLYKLGYLETRGDGERVNYITRPDALERLFRWVLEYVSEQK